MFLRIVVFSIIYFLSWVFVHLMCEYKYFWCSGNCQKCHNWKCKIFVSKNKKGD